METSTPRVTCAYLNSYVGKNVMIVGKVAQIRGEDAIIDADGNISCKLNRVSFHPSSFPSFHLSPPLEPFMEESSTLNLPHTANPTRSPYAQDRIRHNHTDTTSAIPHIIHNTQTNTSFRAKLTNGCVQDAHLSPGNGVQIIGKVNPDLSVKVLSSLDLGTGVDYNLANTVVEISHQHKGLFVYE
ncbi:hypothetical protein B0T21DRAFT_127266 [Apiosordaria backusii]|uniref:Replication factor A protein 3 n=1 Tax=Apiosordaria backusii TaxID=314023 RepID=A0AA40EMX6_9PEZI|nr:hypothetical protein B0T21DRAFT_127266 [Apiosordaria backusii]